MRSIAWLAASLTAALTASVALHSQTGPASTAVLYEGARLIIGDETPPIESGAFLVQDRRITAIGPKGQVAAPAGGRRVDLTGKTVMPAIINTHVHPGWEKFTRPEGDSDLPSYPTNFSVENLTDHLRRFAYYGVGTVLDGGSGVPEVYAQIRADQESQKLVGVAEYQAAGGITPIDGGVDEWLIKGTTPRKAAIMVEKGPEGRAAVQEFNRRGYKYIKLWLGDRDGTYRGMPWQVFEPVVDEAHKLGMKVIIHALAQREHKEAVKAGADWLAHALPTNDRVDQEYAALLAWKKPYWHVMGVSDRSEICTPNPFIDQTQSPALLAALRQPKGLRVCGEPPPPAAAAATAAARKQNFIDMVNAGARPVVGTDGGIFPTSSFGWPEHAQIKSFVTWGLTPAQAIMAATSRAADSMGRTDIGRLAPGTFADFIVLNANPLQNIENTRTIASVYLRGAMIDREAMAAKWRN